MLKKVGENGVLMPKKSGKYEHNKGLGVTKAIVRHIMRFQPRVTKYNENKCPLVRRFDSSISMESLFKDYNKTVGCQEGFAVSHSKFHKVCRQDMRITFIKDSKELPRCTECDNWDQHRADTSWCNGDPTCEKCSEKQKHYKIMDLSAFICYSDSGEDQFEGQ